MADTTAPQLITKKSTETRKLSMDFTAWVDSAVTISNPTVTSEKVSGEVSDLVISGITLTGKKVIFIVAGGTQAQHYQIIVRVDTSDGQILEGDGMFRILNR